MAERDYRWDREDQGWREENRERDENRYDRGERRRFGGRENEEYGRTPSQRLSGYGMEGYGPERRERDPWRFGQSGSEYQRSYERGEPDWHSGRSRTGGEDWGGGSWSSEGNRWQGGQGQGYGWQRGPGQGYDWQRGQGTYQGAPRSGWRPYGSDYYGQTGRSPERMGRPPKNYSRSDERIREDICESIIRAQDIDAGDVEITVQASEVTLTGEVEAREDKRRIEDIAQETSGVTEVHNQLRTRQGNRLREALSRTGEKIKEFMTGEPARDENRTLNDRNKPTTATANPPIR